MERLIDKIALVTGAARGIGLAIAQLFSDEGATVILTDINDESGNMEAGRIGGSTLYRHLDVSNEEHWRQRSEELLDFFGKVDIVVNNAGITGFLETPGAHDPENLDLASWHTVHATNLDGVMHTVHATNLDGVALGCKYGIRMAKESTAASIVNISSRSGIVGISGAAAYASSKAAVRNHTKTVALYCAEQGYNIRCNSIHPAAIMTPMWDAMLGEGAAREAAIAAIEAEIPMKRMGDVLDVAQAALYLGSNESKYVTGIELTIDGGILAGAAASPGD